jgi:hypothetical protein
MEQQHMAAAAENETHVEDPGAGIKRGFLDKAKEGDGRFAIAYALLELADSQYAIACEAEGVANSIAMAGCSRPSRPSPFPRDVRGDC